MLAVRTTRSSDYQTIRLPDHQTMDFNDEYKEQRALMHPEHHVDTWLLSFKRTYDSIAFGGQRLNIPTRLFYEFAVDPLGMFHIIYYYIKVTIYTSLMLMLTPLAVTWDLVRYWQHRESCPQFKSRWVKQQHLDGQDDQDDQDDNEQIQTQSVPPQWKYWSRSSQQRQLREWRQIYRSYRRQDISRSYLERVGRVLESCQYIRQDKHQPEWDDPIHGDDCDMLLISASSYCQVVGLYLLDAIIELIFWSLISLFMPLILPIVLIRILL